jgi:arylsulfatase A-like enzyme
VLAHGFQTYRGALGNLYQDQTTNGAAADYTRWEKVIDAAVTRVTGYVTVDEVDDAIALAGSLPAPWLIHVGFHATHEPHTAPPADLVPQPPPADLSGGRAHFASMLAVLDAQIGRLLDAVPPDTHVVLVADNGDDEDVRPPDRGERQVKGSLFEGGVRVPLIIRSPTVSTPGATSRALVDLTDLFPTLAAWAQRPATGDLDGRSLIPFLLRPDHPDDATAYTERRQPNGLTAPDGGWERWDRAVRDDRFKLLRRQGLPDQLFEVGDALVDGPDLIPRGLTPEAAAAYADLAARLDADRVR